MCCLAQVWFTNMGVLWLRCALQEGWIRWSQTALMVLHHLLAVWLHPAMRMVGSHQQQQQQVGVVTLMCHSGNCATVETLRWAWHCNQLAAAGMPAFCVANNKTTVC
jgi:hypothetical protein